MLHFSFYYRPYEVYTVKKNLPYVSCNGYKLYFEQHIISRSKRVEKKVKENLNVNSGREIYKKNEKTNSRTHLIIT